MYLLFFLYTALLGFLILSLFPKQLPFLVKICLSYLLSTFFLTVSFFLFYPMTFFSSYFLYLPFFILLPIFIYYRKRIIDTYKNFCFEKSDIIIALFSLFFSSLLFLKTVSYDFSTGQTLISGKLWSDFGAHIPLMRSFFPGFNFPPEYPVFAHAPIKYYFLFHFHAGLLEHFGLPLFAAIDIPSILGFTALLLLIYSFGKEIFQRKLVGLLAILFFIFNSSFSWWYFLQKNLTMNIFDLLKKLINLREFPAFNPYDGTLISGGFWNLNVYTNQRHLALSLAVIFLLIFLFLWKRKHQVIFSLNAYLVLGLALSFTPLFHGVVFVLVCLSLPLLFLIDRQKKYFLLLCFIFAVIALPSLIYLKSSVESNQNPAFKFLPGYLTAYTFTWFNFLRYWVLNLGLVFFLAPLGFFLTPKNTRLLFLFALPSFLIGNLFSFSPDVATNHKFFNFSIIIFDVYVAYIVSRLLSLRGTRHPAGDEAISNHAFMRLPRPSPPTGGSGLAMTVGILLIFFLTISGIIDLFPVFNDTYFGIPDPSHKTDIEWIVNNTKPGDVFANSYYLFHPASLAGRKISLGWPYFSWSAGYDTEKRVKHLTDLYLATDKPSACEEIHNLNVDYVTLNLNIRDVNLSFDENFWKNNFPLVYDNASRSGLLIFEARKSCF